MKLELLKSHDIEFLGKVARYQNGCVAFVDEVREGAWQLDDDEFKDSLYVMERMGLIHVSGEGSDRIIKVLTIGRDIIARLHDRGEIPEDCRVGA